LRTIDILGKIETDPIACELAVIGNGMAGMASALFAANRGLSIVQVGVPGGIIFASGLLDLLGVHPAEERKVWQDPWAGIEALTQDFPKHPYARLERKEIEAAFNELLFFLEGENLHYRGREGQNSEMIMPLGTSKQTYCVPKSMWGGVKALKEKRPCLLVDFHGLTDFSATQIAETLRSTWPDLRSARITFPGNDQTRELFTGELMAQAMESSENREKLAQTVRPLVGDAYSIGMPAVFGMNRTGEILAEVEKQIGVPVFEIPTLPVSIPGLRLNDTFARGLTGKGVRRFSQERVLKVHREPGGDFTLGIGNKRAGKTVRAKGVILASGRFWGRGLMADRKRIREAIFDLPVHQPEGRKGWHHKDFLDLRGHPVNRAGLEIDDLFRPLDSSGGAAFERLFAAGSILAHQDWMRMKCGSGLAISSAYAAVNAYVKTAG